MLVGCALGTRTQTCKHARKHAAQIAGSAINEDDVTVTRARFRHLRTRHWLTGQPRPVKSIPPLG